MSKSKKKKFENGQHDLYQNHQFKVPIMGIKHLVKSTLTNIIKRRVSLAFHPHFCG